MKEVTSRQQTQSSGTATCFAFSLIVRTILNCKEMVGDSRPHEPGFFLLLFLRKTFVFRPSIILMLSFFLSLAISPSPPTLAFCYTALEVVENKNHDNDTHEEGWQERRCTWMMLFFFVGRFQPDSRRNLFLCCSCSLLFIHFLRLFIWNEYLYGASISLFTFDILFFLLLSFKRFAWLQSTRENNFSDIACRQ